MKKMFRMVIAALMLAAIVVSLCACGNMQMLDTTYTFDRAIILLPDGTVIDGKIDSWCDYDSDAVQVKMEDGTTYVTHYAKCVLIAEDD